MKFKKLLKNEDGAAELIEASIIYPIVILFIFVLIYMGLYLLQLMSLSAYAQKVALLASRELAYPGYVEMLKSTDYAAYSNAAVEGTDELISSISLESTPKNAQAHAYRYWNLVDPLSGSTDGLVKITKNMVKNNSIMGSKDEIVVDIKAKNYFVTQYVTVDVKQTLIEFPVLTFFGIPNPTVAASATASVNDTDEFIRNVDFVTDALDMLARKLGIDVDKVSGKVKEIKEKFGLN